jgi:predicted nucleotidyltransferase
MSTPTGADKLNGVLFGKTRRALLSLLLSHPDESYYLRQMDRLTGVGMGALQGELKVLSESEAGIISIESRGRQSFFQSNPKCPVFEELKSLVLKTSGAASLLRAALAPLAGDIQVAFIFGSLAQGGHTRQSDVDIMVVGNVDFGQVVSAFSTVQEALAREINPVVYSKDEFKSKATQGVSFIKRVLESPKIFLTGDADDLKKLAG